jgi:hypothetical protein
MLKFLAVVFLILIVMCGLAILGLGLGIAGAILGVMLGVVGAAVGVVAGVTGALVGLVITVIVAAVPLLIIGGIIYGFFRLLTLI